MSLGKPPLVVIDTNVWISGIFWSGNPKKILTLVKQHTIIPVFSYSTFYELKRIHERSSLLLMRVGEANIELKNIKRWGAFFEPRAQSVQSRDPYDAMFLDLSVASAAQFLITGDQDVLSIKKIGTTKILTPKQFLQTFKKSVVE